MKGRHGTEKRARQYMVSVRLSDDERRVVNAKAAAAQLKVTDYVRQAALHREVAAGANVIAELRRLGALQRTLFLSGHNASESAQVLRAIMCAIERIATSDTGAA